MYSYQIIKQHQIYFAIFAKIAGYLQLIFVFWNKRLVFCFRRIVGRDSAG
jgi:hypothetical protein